MLGGCPCLAFVHFLYPSELCAFVQENSVMHGLALSTVDYLLLCTVRAQLSRGDLEAIEGIVMPAAQLNMLTWRMMLTPFYELNASRPFDGKHVGLGKLKQRLLLSTKIHV